MQIPGTRRFALLVALGLSVCAPRSSGAQQGAKNAPERPQILWQRSLDDALAIAAAENRPLFVAINVDGESASDRVTVERYRDPLFVRWTQSFVCVVASISRHNPRDFDDRGKRIPCPRLGEVTCGEHIALEPLLFDRCLGGTRIAPRHAVILPDKTKCFDLFEQWDWTELDRRVQELAASAPPAPASAEWPNPLTTRKTEDRLAQWRVLAGTRQARGRAACENALSKLQIGRGMSESLDAIAEVGNAGSLDALRLFLCRAPAPNPELVDAVGNVAAALKVGPQVSALVRQRLSAPGKYPGAPGLDDDRVLLPLVARFDAASSGTRSFLLACFAIGDERDRRVAGAAVSPALSRDEVVRMAGAIEAEGGATQIAELIVFARDVGRTLPRVARAEKPLPALDVLERELDESDRALGANQGDVAAQERFGLASLSIARRYRESGGGNPALHLADARTWLARAASARPHDAALSFERARVAYLLGQYEEQERIALEAFGGYPARDALPAPAAGLADYAALGDGDVRRAATLIGDEDRLEALRWAGDAAARLAATRSGQDPAVEVAGLVRGSRALALVAVSPSSDETDWMSLASFLAAIGLERDALAAWETGIDRFPESNALRDGLTRSLWRSGRTDLGPPKADWFASRNPESGACAWYAGQAWILAAEDARRQQAAGAAIEAYTQARARFRASLALEPRYEAAALGWVARAELGGGFALFDLGRRQSAADALAAAIACSAGVLDVRDGLDREAVDLVDSLLEWRGGRPSPMDPGALADQLSSAAPGSPRMALAVADSELREGLRADGRSTERLATAEGALEHAPNAEGDGYIEASIAVGRRALGIAETDETRARLAQSLSVHAERWLARADAAAARPLLVEAATLLGESPPAAEGDMAALKACAAGLRARLGPARPIARPGR